MKSELLQLILVLCTGFAPKLNKSNELLVQMNLIKSYFIMKLNVLTFLA